jgi:hypothetical protein
MPFACWRADIQARMMVYMLILASAGFVSGCAGVPGAKPAPPPTPGPGAERVPSSVSRPPNTQELHDLAIAAVDFDPEFDSHRIFSGRSYNLLVAVENKGNRPEGPLTVSLQLLTEDRQRLLMAAQRTLQALAPGGVTVVRFPGETPTPAQRLYVLNTQVEAIPREANLSNNRRTLEIQAK